MPEKRTIQRARKQKRRGKAGSTQAGEFVREEMHHVRRGKHGARSTKQAIAIGLSKARRSGVKVGTPRKGRASATTRRKAAQDMRAARRRKGRPSAKRSRAVSQALKRERRGAAARRSLSRQAKTVAHRRSKAERSRAAKKAARTRKRRSRS
jgi:hypothetical protein